jgi:hypothetical protein
MTLMADADGAGEKSGREPKETELRREAITMALYVAICLVAGLAALPDTEGSHAHLLGIIWGVTIGLAAAHWFAFRVATRRVSAGRYRRSDVQLAAAQLVGAAAVAVFASIPVVLFPKSLELEATELLLAAFVAAVGYLAKRGSGASRPTAVLYALVVLSAAAAIVVLKNWLAGH